MSGASPDPSSGGTASAADATDAWEAFERIASRVDGPVYVVTAVGGGRRAGCLVGFATQCSIEPVRFAVCLSKANRTHEVAQDASSLVVHSLRGDQGDLARVFGAETGDEVDKFAGLDCDEVADGVVLRGCDWFGGPIVTRVDGGDHELHVIEVRAGRAGARGRLLGYQDVRDLDAGHPAGTSDGR